MQMSITKILHTAILALLMIWAVASADGKLSEPERCSDQDVTYTVKKGDSLYEISKKFGSTLFWESGMPAFLAKKFFY